MSVIETPSPGPPTPFPPCIVLLQEQEKLAREKERADAKVAKEREKELARLEGERRKHLERVMKEQARGGPLLLLQRCPSAVHACAG